MKVGDKVRCVSLYSIIDKKRCGEASFIHIGGVYTIRGIINNPGDNKHGFFTINTDSSYIQICDYHPSHFSSYIKDVRKEKLIKIGEYESK